MAFETAYPLTVVSPELPSPSYLPLSRLSPRSLNSGTINGLRRQEISPSCFHPVPFLSLLLLLYVAFSPYLSFRLLSRLLAAPLL